jgi:hypothetical protein
MSGDREKYVSRPDMLERVDGSVELTPEEERHVEELQHLDHADLDMVAVLGEVAATMGAAPS